MRASRKPRRPWTACWFDSPKEVTAPPSHRYVNSGPSRRILPMMLPAHRDLDSFRGVFLNRDAGDPNFPMKTFYVDLAAALEERLAVIADQTLRTEQPEL